MFYRRNDSPLFGDFLVTENRPEKRKRTPSIDGIREMFKALRIQQRALLS